MKKIFAASSIFSISIAVPNPKLMLADNLDEPSNYGFCLDLKGWGENTKFTDV